MSRILIIFFNKKVPPTNQKKVNLPVTPIIRHTNNSSDNIQPVVQPKPGLVFDDYY